MVIHTPRLCNDITFLPPRENRANGISCREIMNEAQQEQYHRLKAKAEQAEALKLLEETSHSALDDGQHVEEDAVKGRVSVEDDMLYFLHQEV